MDPQTNLERQRELAESILAMEGKLEIRETGKPTRAVWHYADELAELVLALDEWRSKGGFDPYDKPQAIVHIVTYDHGANAQAFTSDQVAQAFATDLLDG